MRKVFPVILALVAVVIMAAVGYSALFRRAEVTIGGRTIPVEVVRTDYSRQKGLSGRDTLPTGTGMLFVFDTPGDYGFWMKEMKFPLDIIWFDEQGMVVHIEKNLSPDTYPSIFYPGSPSLYVLELNAGDVEKDGVGLGVKAEMGLK